MSMEQDLQAALVALCPRVFQVIAPAPQTQIYVTWQAIGGHSLRYLENTPAGLRNTLVQVNVWALKSSDTTTLIRQIEDALCASAAFTALPQGEALSTYEPDTKLFGALQRFSVYAAR